MYKILSYILFLFVSFQTFAQEGRPFVQNFPPYEYVGEDQVWSICQNKNGVLYFGVGDGLLSYNGVHWKKNIINDNKSPILSSVLGDDNYLYVGSVGEFGYFNTNNEGVIKYNSLVNLLDSTNQLFTDIWSVGKSNDNIYFATDNSIFRYNRTLNPKIKRLKTSDAPFLLYNPDNKIFISFRDKGLYAIKEDSIIKVNIKKKLIPWFIIPYKKNIYLLGDTDDYLQLLYYNEKDTLSKITTELFDKEEITKTNNFFKNSRFYTGATVLNNNQFAIGTIRKGIVIINKKGKIVNVIGKKENILSSTVHKLFLDKQGELWAGLSYGISRIEYNSPFTFFDEEDGVDGTLYNLIYYKDILYASSNLGLYYFENSKFVGLDEFTGKNSVQVFLPMIFPSENKIDSIFLVTTINGIYSINGKTSKRINSLSPNMIFQSDLDKSIFYCGEDYKLYAFSRKGESFTEPNVISEFNGIVSGGLEIDQERVWLIVDGKPIIFNVIKKTSVNYSKNIELSGITITGIGKQKGEALFLTDNGFYLFNKSQNKFYKDTSIISKYVGKQQIIQHNQVSESLTWTLIGNNLHSTILQSYKTQNRTYIDSVPFKRLFNFHTLSSSGDSLLWIISSKAIYKYRINLKKDYKPKSLPIITKITIGSDSVVYNGHCLNTKSPLFGIETIYDYEHNNINFEYALAEFDNEKANEFKCFLKGNGVEKESNWTRETHKEFSNLYEGHYVFMLKARNVYQKETEYIKFEFEILPPWFRTWWAYLLYLIILINIVLVIIKLNTRRLERENVRLDNIVKERTAEIYLQKEEIQTQADNLEEVNTKLNETNDKISLIANNLKEANKNIKNKNIYITDSINYAKKIQKAILPSTKEISEIFEQYFVIYKPKDIVGGDFYFFKKIKNIIVVASADCTGHGVPGGFLSMMGVSFLNEIIQNKNIQNPAQALNSLRQKFKHSLRQKDYFSNSTDGIDIALCAIDTNTGILEYSGANSPLIIIRDNEVFELKPDLQPIGIFFKEQDFTLNSFQLKVNDIVYMFSDGLQDQFGGVNNKKLLLKNLIRILKKYSKLPLEEQREKILQSYFHWKGDKTQIDDILIVGFKITNKL